MFALGLSKNMLLLLQLQTETSLMTLSNLTVEAPPTQTEEPRSNKPVRDPSGVERWVRSQFNVRAAVE